MIPQIEIIRQLIASHPELEHQLSRIITIHQFRRSQLIDATSDMRHYSIFLTNGSARMYFLKNGKEHTFSVAFEGEFVTMSRLLIDNNDIPTRIEFLEPSQAVFVPMDKLSDHIRNTTPEIFSTFAEVIIHALLAYTMTLEERLIIFQTYSAAERYRWFTTRYPDIKKRLNGTQIASLLGVSRETLYRIRSNKYTAAPK